MTTTIRTGRAPVAALRNRVSTFATVAVAPRTSVWPHDLASWREIESMLVRARPASVPDAEGRYTRTTLRVPLVSRPEIVTLRFAADVGEEVLLLSRDDDGAEAPGIVESIGVAPGGSVWVWCLFLQPVLSSVVRRRPQPAQVTP